MIHEATQEEVMDGLRGRCDACGQEVIGVEPDANDYPCESCGEHKVYGLQELLLMGQVRLTDD